MRWRILLMAAVTWLTLQASAALAQQSVYPQAEPHPRQASAHEATRQLAARSLAGPRAALVVGAILVTATPFVAALSSFAAYGQAGGSLIGCEDWISGDTDEECEHTDDNASRTGARTGFAVGAGMGVLAAGVIALGVVRDIQIHRARRRLRLEPTLALGRGTGQVSLTLGF